MLTFDLRTIELQVELKILPPGGVGKIGCKRRVMGQPHPIGVEQQIVNSGVRLDPLDKLEKLRVQGGFAAGKLKDFNAAFAVDHALDAALQFAQWHGIDSVASA